MYESPINTIISDMVKDIVKKQDDQLLRVVQNVGINVDRDELLKALEYDRGQYQKGYVDGIKEFAERLSEKAPHITEERFIILRYEINNLVKEMTEEQKHDND